MFTLYVREECPYCVKIRRFLNDHALSARLVYVPRLASERRELAALAGVATPTVPALHDPETDTFIQDTEGILGWLKEHHVNNPYGEPRYGLTRTLDGVSYADAIPAVKAALAAEGFGILTEIDVRATMKMKLNVDHRPYIILGACNPPMALRALTAELPVGLLLPCNVVVTEDDGGNAIISAIDPRAMFKVLERDDIAPLADEVRGMLTRALAAV